MWKGLSDFGEEEDFPAAAPSPTRQPLLRLPGYELLEEIARGGMGIVYRARQLDPRRTVALKMLLPHQLGSPEMAERFRLEVRTLTELEHPAILPVHHTGEHQGMPFFTMKLATGGTLAQRKAQLAGRWRAIAELMATLADAVQFAHERGVLHRDLKPGNILFDDQDRPYISDFGLAKLATADHDLTRSVDFLGTPHYIAPEVAATSARSATTASDRYSLGAMLYELLCGHPPFEAETAVALLKKIVEEEPAAPSKSRSSTPDEKSKVQSLKSNETVPRDLEVICLKCLAKEPARRYASAREFAEDLRRWLEGREILARPAGPMERAWLWARRHRATAVALGLATILLLALVVGSSLAAWHIAASRREALRSLEALEVQKANSLLADGSTAEGIALLARRVRDNPDSWADCARLMWALQRRRWAVPLQPPFRAATFLASTEDPNSSSFVRAKDQRLLGVFVGTNVIVRDIESGTNRHEWPLPFAPKWFKVHSSGLVELTDASQQVWTFDALQGRMLQPLVTPESQLRTSNLLAVPCGQRVLVVAADQSVSLVDLQSGSSKPLVAAPSGGAAATNVARAGHWYGLDRGRKLVFSDGERTVRVVDCMVGELVGPALIASDRVEGIIVSPDERVLATITSEGLTQFWDTESHRQLAVPPDVGVNFGAQFLPGRSQCILACNPFGLVLFDPLTGERSKLPPRGDLVAGTCQMDGSARLVAVTFQKGGTVFDLATCQPLCEPVALSQVCIASENHGHFASRGADGLTVLWSVKTNRAESIVLHHPECVVSARFSSDGQRVVTASYDGTGQVWDARTGHRVGVPLSHSRKLWSACFSPDGRRVATASWDASARIWDAASGAPLSPPLQANSYVFHVEFSPDGERLLSCGEDGVTRLYDGHTGKAVWQLPSQGPTYWAHFSPDGRTLVTRPSNADPSLWDAQTGRLLVELKEPSLHRMTSPPITRGDFSRDGAWLALGSPEHYATVWHLPEGRLQAVLHQGEFVRSALFTPDARTVLTTADDLAARLWDARTGKASSPPLTAHRRPGSREFTPSVRAGPGHSLRAAAIHSDGRRAVTGGSDASVRLWDVHRGLPLGEPAEFEGEIMDAQFSPDGARLLVACANGTAHILPLPPVVEHAPDWLAPLAEALVFQRFDAQGATVVVSPVELWDACEALRRLPQNDPVVRWARDLLDL